MENNFKRKIKNINEVILDNLIIKKNSSHTKNKNTFTNQKGGFFKTTVDLKKTQSELLKTIKNFEDIKIPKTPAVKYTFDDINKELTKISKHFLFLSNNKFIESKPEVFFDGFTNFDKLMNDISGGKIENGYDNNHKLATPLKLNLDSLNFLVDDIDDLINFKERTEKISIQKILEKQIPQMDIDTDQFINKLKQSSSYIEKNYETIQTRIKKILDEFKLIEKILVNIERRIAFFKLEFDTNKIRDIVERQIIIEEIEEEEFEELNGLDELIEIPKVSFQNKFIVINGKKYELDSDAIYTNPEFVDIIHNQTGGSIDKYIEIAIKYKHIIKKRELIPRLQKKVEEYNIIYIQYYYYQFYILNNVNKFYTGNKETQGILPIYKNLTYTSVETFWKILYKLNEVIDNPKEIFSDIDSRERTVHAVFYFKYFIIIKILFEFFNTIKKVWDNKKLDKKYKVNLLDYDEKENKDIIKYILLFNLSYAVFVNYSNAFMRKIPTL